MQQVGLRRLHEEGVLHFAGRVVRLEVQGVEVEPLGFDLRAFGDFPAHAHEDVADAVLQRGERVAGTGTAAARRRGDIHGFLDQDPRVVLGFELGGAGRERLVDASAGGAHELAGGGLLVLGQPADLSVGQAQRRLLAGVGQTGRLEFVQVEAALKAIIACSTAAATAASSSGLGTSCSWAGGVTSDMCCWDLGRGSRVSARARATTPV